MRTRFARGGDGHVNEAQHMIDLLQPTPHTRPSLPIASGGHEERLSGGPRRGGSTTAASSESHDPAERLHRPHSGKIHDALGAGQQPSHRSPGNRGERSSVHLDAACAVGSRRPLWIPSPLSSTLFSSRLALHPVLLPSGRRRARRLRHLDWRRRRRRGRGSRRRASGAASGSHGSRRARKGRGSR